MFKEYHHISISENCYEHIGTLLRAGAGDPALKVNTPILSMWVSSYTLSDFTELSS